MRLIGLKIAVAGVLIALSGASAPAVTGQPDAVLATVGKYKITEQEVDAKLKAQLASLQIQLYELKKSAVEEIANDYLVQQAAKNVHLSVDQYLKREVDDKMSAPSDNDLHKIYDQLKGQINQPYDKVKSSLAGYAKEQRRKEGRDELMAKLRARHGLKILLKAPRFDVVADDRPSLGPQSAPVTIVEFGDFQCPFCKRAEDALNRVRAKYGDKVRLVYADYPLGMHQHAFEAARASRCAGEQGKFWPYHDALYADQSKLAPGDLKADAAKLKLDTGKFNACFDKSKYDSDVRKDMENGQSLGVEGTPAFFINGRPLLGSQPFPKFEEIIDEELAAGNNKQARAHD